MNGANVIESDPSVRLASPLTCCVTLSKYLPPFLGLVPPLQDI